MIAQLFYVDEQLCFLNVSIKSNNTYWIDWEEISTEDSNTITDNSIFHSVLDKNILCVDSNNNYYYYNTKQKTFNELTNLKLGLCVDGIKTLSDLFMLQDAYRYETILID